MGSGNGLLVVRGNKRVRWSRGKLREWFGYTEKRMRLGGRVVKSRIEEGSGGCRDVRWRRVMMRRGGGGLEELRRGDEGWEGKG